MCVYTCTHMRARTHTQTHTQTTDVAIMISTEACLHACNDKNLSYLPCYPECLGRVDIEWMSTTMMKMEFTTPCPMDTILPRIPITT